MSLHRSLKSGSSLKSHRNVLNRLEKIKKLKEKEKWSEDKNSIFGLPKVRSIKLKVKSKVKAAPGEEEKKEGEAKA